MAHFDRLEWIVFHVALENVDKDDDDYEAKAIIPNTVLVVFFVPGFYSVEINLQLNRTIWI